MWGLSGGKMEFCGECPSCFSLPSYSYIYTCLSSSFNAMNPSSSDWTQKNTPILILYLIFSYFCKTQFYRSPLTSPLCPALNSYRQFFIAEHSPRNTQNPLFTTVAPSFSLIYSIPQPTEETPTVTFCPFMLTEVRFPPASPHLRNCSKPLMTFPL